MKRVVAVEVPDNVFLLRVHLSAPPPSSSILAASVLQVVTQHYLFFLSRYPVPGTQNSKLHCRVVHQSSP